MRDLWRSGWSGGHLDAVDVDLGDVADVQQGADRGELVQRQKGAKIGDVVDETP